MYLKVNNFFLRESWLDWTLLYKYTYYKNIYNNTLKINY